VSARSANTAEADDNTLVGCDSNQQYAPFSAAVDDWTDKSVSKFIDVL